MFRGDLAEGVEAAFMMPVKQRRFLTGIMNAAPTPSARFPADNFFIHPYMTAILTPMGPVVIATTTTKDCEHHDHQAWDPAKLRSIDLHSIGPRLGSYLHLPDGCARG